MDDEFNQLLAEELSLEEICLITEEAAPAPEGSFDVVGALLLQEGRSVWAYRILRVQIDAGLERYWRDPDAHRPDPNKDMLDDTKPYQAFDKWERRYQPLTRGRLGVLAQIHAAINDPVVKDRLRQIMEKLAIPPARIRPLPELRVEP